MVKRRCRLRSRRTDTRCVHSNAGCMKDDNLLLSTECCLGHPGTTSATRQRSRLPVGFGKRTAASNESLDPAFSVYKFFPQSSSIRLLSSVRSWYVCNNRRAWGWKKRWRPWLIGSHEPVSEPKEDRCMVVPCELVKSR